MRRLPSGPSISSNGAKTRPHERHPTCHKMISTRPAAVCSTRGRVRRPWRAKSLPARHFGHRNGASRSRTGAHFAPQTLSISRSCASSKACASACRGTSLPICTAKAWSVFHDTDPDSSGISIVKASVVVALHIGGDSSTRG